MDRQGQGPSSAMPTSHEELRVRCASELGELTKALTFAFQSCWALRSATSQHLAKGKELEFGCGRVSGDPSNVPFCWFRSFSRLLFVLLRYSFIMQSRLELAILLPHTGIISVNHLTAAPSHTWTCTEASVHLLKGTVLAMGSFLGPSQHRN